MQVSKSSTFAWRAILSFDLTLGGLFSKKRLFGSYLEESIKYFPACDRRNVDWSLMQNVIVIHDRRDGPLL